MVDAADDYFSSKTPGSSSSTPGVPASAPSDSQPPISQPIGQTQSVDPADNYFSSPLVGKAAPSGTGSYTPADHDESDRFTQDDPGANWLEKSWSFANKPLTESLLGWGLYRHGAGGIERAVEKTASGLFTPLSAAMFAAFAPAGVAEGVAGSLLKEGLTEGGGFLGEEALDGVTAAQKVESYARAVDAAKKAQISGNSIQSAVESTGLQYQEYKNYGQYLRNQGLQETDILGSNLARRFASQGLRKVGVTPNQAVRIAKGAETLVNAGFGIQMVKGAIYAFPRAADLLSQGDYDGAAEYLTEGGLGTVFGTLGVAHGLASIGDIVPSLNEKEALPISDQTEAFNKVFNHMQGDITASQVQIADRKRSHLIGLMEIAGVDVPAGLRRRLEFTGGDEARMSELQNFEGPLT